MAAELNNVIFPSISAVEFTPCYLCTGPMEKISGRFEKNWRFALTTDGKIVHNRCAIGDDNYLGVRLLFWGIIGEDSGSEKLLQTYEYWDTEYPEGFWDELLEKYPHHMGVKTEPQMLQPTAPHPEAPQVDFEHDLAVSGDECVVCKQKLRQNENLGHNIEPMNSSFRVGVTTNFDFVHVDCVNHRGKQNFAHHRLWAEFSVSNDNYNTYFLKALYEYNDLKYTKDHWEETRLELDTELQPTLLCARLCLPELPKDVDVTEISV